MITIPVKIKECSDSEFLVEKQNNYSFAFRKLYKHFAKVEKKTRDEDFITYVRKEFNLNYIEFTSLVNDVSTKVEQMKTINENKVTRIAKLNKEITVLTKIGKKKPSTKNTRLLYRNHKKIKSLENSLRREITFGCKETQRVLTKLYNNIDVIMCESDLVKREELLAANQQKIDEQTELWYSKRVIHFYLLGEANQKGNRFMKFDFANKTLIYKHTTVRK